LPDKAIDLIDEAASKLRLEMNSVPEEVDEIERRIKQLEIEREAIKRESDQLKLTDLAKELAVLIEKRSVLRARWQVERDIIDKIQKNKSDIENYKLEADTAERNGDYGKVAELRYGKIREAERQIEEYQNELKKAQADNPLIKEEVDTEDIAEVVSRWTGVPVNRMVQSEREKLLKFEDELHKRVVGQDVAIGAIADAVRRNRAGLSDAKRPIGSFIFLGTTGVGKTELARTLAEYLFNDENLLTRIDMSEYQERHSVSRLIGAPPGYVGYDEGGQLTEAVRHKPYSVVLLDEIEKAHPDVFNILLQVLEDGRLTDNKGRVVNFKNTIIVMTSNIGSHIIQEGLSKLNGKNDDDAFEKIQNDVFQLMKQTIRPEFLNRIDEIVVFAPLTMDQIREVVRIQFENLKKQLAESDIEIELTGSALNWIAEKGYDPQFGARPVKRVLQKQVVNELSKMVISGELNKGEKIIVDSDGEKLIFHN
jgi:ATP-dependent Clp protease ATP-binding subunit ClpB